MQHSSRVILTMGCLVALVAGMYLFSDWFSKTTGYVLGEDQKIAFADCLSEKNVIFYEKEHCAACEEQRRLFGEQAWEHIMTHTCIPGSCTGLASLPAWEIEGAFHYGFQTFQDLDEHSSCNLETPAS